MVSSFNGVQLSIIIPVFNGEDYIERAVNSIYQESISEIEIIIVDDGSTDRTFELCQMLALNRTNISVLTQSNRGVSIARNKGLSRAAGDYIWFVDADDYIEPNTISCVLKIAKESNLDLLQFGFNIISAKNNVAKSLRVKGSKILPFPEYLSEGYFKGVLWQSLIKKSCIDGAVFSDNVRLGEDGLFFMSIFKNIKTAKRIELKVYNYCQNDHSITHNIPFEMCLKIEERINQFNLPIFATNYRNVFIAYYASLAIFSDDYNEDVLFQYMQSQNVLVKRLFFVRLVQNLFTYNYGLLKRKRGRLLRLDVLKRAKSLTKHLAVDHHSFMSKFVHLGFRFIPSVCLDFLLCSVSPIIKLITLRY